MHISLPESLKRWVEKEVQRGGYGTASEYVRHLLREEQKRQLREDVDSKLLEALDSGDSIPGEVVFKRLRTKSEARRRKSR